MCAMREKISGSCSLTHSNLVSVKLGSAGLAVSSMSRSRPMTLCSHSHCGSVRTSHQMSAGRRTLPSLSSMTAPCIWPVRPTASMCTPLASTSRMAFCAARHQSSGSCSAQPGCGVRNGSCSAEAEPTSCPFSSTSTARVPPVPTSIPRNTAGLQWRFVRIPNNVPKPFCAHGAMSVRDLWFCSMAFAF